MNKVIASMMSAILVMAGLCVSAGAQQQQQVLPPGCTSTVGYSPTTGVKCDSVTTVTVDTTATVSIPTIETKTIPGGKRTVTYHYKGDNCVDQIGHKTVPWGSRTVVTGTKMVDQQVAVKVQVPVVPGAKGERGEKGEKGDPGRNALDDKCYVDYVAVAANEKGKTRNAYVRFCPGQDPVEVVKDKNGKWSPLKTVIVVGAAVVGTIVVIKVIKWLLRNRGPGRIIN